MYSLFRDAEISTSPIRIRQRCMFVLHNDDVVRQQIPRSPLFAESERCLVSVCGSTYIICNISDVYGLAYLADTFCPDEKHTFGRICVQSVQSGVTAPQKSGIRAPC